jgi:cytidylate kinase
VSLFSLLREAHILVELLMDKIVIAIDGPSGSGKSTLGKAIARKLGYLYIDSGAVYRAIGVRALRLGVSLDDHARLAAVTREADIRLEGDPDHLRVYLDGEDVTETIRMPEASNASSVVATVPEVRAAVVDMLRAMARGGGVVMDGRDIGTKVFPDAKVKLFLNASAEVRAHRRCQEERALGRNVSLEQVRSEIEERDKRDTQRAATPLVRADGAIDVDNSFGSVGDLVQHVVGIIEAAVKSEPATDSLPPQY